MNKVNLSKLILTFLTLLPFTQTQAYELILEAGAVWQERNDVKIEPDTGTYFEFNDFDRGPFFHYRLEAKKQLSEKHALRLVYAPFNLEVKDTPKKAITFEDTTFNTTEKLTVKYMFNSYRLSYAYKLYSGTDSWFDIGLSAKVRDAEISLKQGSNKESYDNVGFVPLFYIAYMTKFSDKWSLFSDFDFAYASQGQAFDFAIKFRRSISESQKLGIGYRTLEGGADNDKVLSWSWFNYALLDYTVSY
jgi:hypothetical protein